MATSRCIFVSMYVCVCVYVCVCARVCAYSYIYGKDGYYSRLYLWSFIHVCDMTHSFVSYGVAAISRQLKIIGLYCKRALYKRQYSAKETYDFNMPTHRSRPITWLFRVWHCMYSYPWHVNLQIYDQLTCDT